MSDNKLPQLVMFLSTLEDLPPNSLPEGYSLRHYSGEEDAQAWNRIIWEAFQWQTDFSQAIKAEEVFRPERVWFVCCGQEPVGTATAWYRPQWGETTGYLHMVGCCRSMPGKGWACRPVWLHCIK
ncbi:MAG TPA: hypothetical protein GX505_11635 [Clostridiales bacterium]|nr:hypothetical protein [Clostridiales bacterium]